MEFDADLYFGTPLRLRTGRGLLGFDRVRRQLSRDPGLARSGAGSLLAGSISRAFLAAGSCRRALSRGLAGCDDPQMPSFSHGEVEIHYIERGEGFPVLLFAPGGMRSASGFWKNSPWNPVAELSDRFRVISMDQRNAGKSTAPLSRDDGWHCYTADHLALLDHLEIERAHLIGGCIGGPYCLGVMQAAPERVASAVLQQPIGFSGSNREAFYEMFDSWASELASHHPKMTEDDWLSFRSNMYDGDFVFNVDRDFVRGCNTPMLVLLGNDLYHPEVTSREIAELAPQAELVERWQEPEVVPETVKRVRSFLQSHTP